MITLFLLKTYGQKKSWVYFSPEKKNVVYNCISSEGHLFNPNESKYIVLFTKQTVKKYT